MYATTIARQLKNDYPDCSVTWAVAPFCASILEENPFIDSTWQVEYLNHRDLKKFRKDAPRLFAEAADKGFTKIFFTQLIEDNLVFYNGQVRSSIFAASGLTITVPIEPVLHLRQEEVEKVKNFVLEHAITENDFVILFESAPQSGQLAINATRALEMAENISAIDKRIKVIVSSQNKTTSANKAVIDGSALTLRETAQLTHYCHLLLGCSSGITWASTSSAAKKINSLQLLDRQAYIYNSPILDHKRNGLNTDRWLELYDFDDAKITSCIKEILANGFSETREKYSQPVYPTFRFYRGVVHHFLKQGKLRLTAGFIKKNFRLYGFNRRMTAAILLGIILFPVQAMVDGIKKK